MEWSGQGNGSGRDQYSEIPFIRNPHFLDHAAVGRARELKDKWKPYGDGEVDMLEELKKRTADIIGLAGQSRLEGVEGERGPVLSAYKFSTESFDGPTFMAMFSLGELPEFSLFGGLCSMSL